MKIQLPASISAANGAADGYGKPGDPDWRTIDWREHLRSATVDGLQVNYCDYGSGPPVVLVHGLGGSWQNWLENIPALGRTHRVIAPDLPGFGHSEMPDEVSIGGYARNVKALLDQLGIESAVVIGNSMGGFIAAEMAIQFPSLVEELVLASAAGISSAQARRSPVLAWGRVNTAIATRLAARTEFVVRRPRLRHLTFNTIVRHPTRVPQDMLYELAYSSGRPGFMPALRALLDYDFTGRLEEIKAPTLVIWGSEDMIVDPGDADRWENAIPGARKVVFQDTGHLPMVEHAQEFNELLEEFIGAGEREPAAV